MGFSTKDKKEQLPQQQQQIVTINSIESAGNKSAGSGGGDNVKTIYRQNTAKAINVAHFSESNNAAAKFLRKKTKEDHIVAMTGTVKKGTASDKSENSEQYDLQMPDIHTGVSENF